ncbi:4-(cytidine 5'-diphospho)-2-C-methyl-D-erythritol kinase [Chlamydia abortus]|uniref:4-diphosphocytidyl-2-C-methyl-D-erythritol kinase n=1 Tax=Chlamydia abortus (strain DSM 27085 / S26/3) TaxID=218497 RepID=ISPE_CHLAB|nr:4-(cytidine 5'-diphospho)-2-C-methyl-D-erythritol kinase [Chlamydia abortus]Q5L568.1 RecName: Full=4-diphosphocytidyl-2-C-methyl-D-erythritol kinase; Short=CMK; AltName: Full=4-(cytidine-5'-diphospho)-2-C-methyl-D-erythritol kinase [Chlamydia abortus S26/3]ASD30891.1 4-diphosphocytidyl-2C-methyl-D-erythritol kinase [Chlamydia abortus]AUS60266.1 4-diphosphocytidyl-2-C-methyl-D-erythritol kinase [Chlamydia abortus]QRR32217.1 4-(cytidine 5'-diphospho)-2-C-methyl-D-erythritol kinase [Chlamydia a
MDLFSPAKLNLFLKLHGKTSHGFHEMTTLYQVIDFGDRLSLESSSEDSLICNLPELNTPQNLIWKSIQVFRDYTQIYSPVAWRLYKCIPIGSGIGGGSSNAATALYALNQHFQTQLSNDVLQELGKKIGMDVPLFFSLGSALGIGCGEEILSYDNDHRDERYVLYFSDQPVLTKDAFSYVRPEDFSKREECLSLYARNNDLEQSVFRFRKDLEEKKHMLKRIWSPFNAHVRMSGAGATLFVSYSREIETDPSTAKALHATIHNSQGLLVNSLRKYNGWFEHGDNLLATTRQ